MPYGVRKKGKKYQVYNKNTGRVLGTHDSEEKAEAQRRALYANEPDAKKKRKRK